MKRLFSLPIIVLFAISITNAQNVGINNNGSAPHTSAMLDVNNANKGLLIPRVALTGTDDATTILTPAISLLVYNTVSTAGANAVTRGYYYWDGSVWLQIAVNISPGNNGSWLRTGNTATIDGTHFIGTTDNVPFNVKVNNMPSGRIDHILGNTFWGYQSGLNTTGTSNTANGYYALRANTTGNSNTANGTQALSSNTTGFQNTANGSYSLQSNTIGNHNTATGTQALQSTTTGGYNTATGTQAMQSNLFGNNNSAYGGGALLLNTTGSDNTATGLSALLKNTSGSNNTASGANALGENPTGSNNTAVGYYSIQGPSGDNNTAVGATALGLYRPGNNNTAIGYGADLNVSNIDNASAIGAGSKVSNANSMAFGSTSVTGWAFGRTSVIAGAALQVGTAAVNGNGATLSLGGTWTNASDSTLKENITALDGASIFSKIKELPITKWKYKGTNEYHIGPMAQDFYSLFNVGVNNTSISTLDPAGIALKAIQYQQTLLEAEQTKNAEQQKQIDALQKDVEELKQLLKDSFTKTR